MTSFLIMAVSPTKYLSLPVTILSIISKIRTQQGFLSEHIAPILSGAEQHNDGSLTDADFKKITRYYGLAVPAVLGEAFCILHERDMSQQERWASTCQGAMTGLFDDFFDKDYMEDEQVKNKITTSSATTAQQSNEELFDRFYKKALSNVPDKIKMQEALLAVHEAQVKSKQQLDPTVSLENIEAITIEKGGTSLLFYRTAFSPTPTVQETELLHHLGGTMQLANDIFDVYKDREKNVRTLMTETERVDSVRTLLNERLRKGYFLAYQMPYKPAAIRKFLNILSIGIFSRCFVCLDYLEKNEKLTNNSFRVGAYSRSQLICDMDTKKNMLRSAAYHLKTIM